MPCPAVAQIPATRRVAPLLRAAALLAVLAAAPPTRADEPAPEARGCATTEATESFRAGFEAQRLGRSDDALTAYRRCLGSDPACVVCLYEKGWSHWSRGEWRAAAEDWQRVLAIEPHEGAATWLPQARQNAGAKKGGKRVAIGARSAPAKAPVSLDLRARFQNYDSSPGHPADRFDQDISSPKSARFSRDGRKLYVNSLEGMRTAVYDADSLDKLRTVEHAFDAGDAPLFRGEQTVFDYSYHRQPADGDVNAFRGRPVESALSHGGRFLWVPYYRRDFDRGATSPSAVAIIDTGADTIVRVMPTGPIPKYVAISPDDHWAAIVHWGDNTVGLVDISSGDAATFHYAPERLVVERALPQEGLIGKNRDKECGFCLRGTVFTPDSSTLLVARMGGGGIAGFDVASRRYLGTVVGMKPTPRHLAVSPDRETLYFSSNVSGYVSSIGLPALVGALRDAGGRRVSLSGFREVYVGGGARTIEISPDGRYVYAAVNSASEVVVVDTRSMDVVARAPTDPFAVGLAVAPDGRRLVTTSQGRKGEGGGNSVCVFDVRYDALETADAHAGAR